MNELVMARMRETAAREAALAASGDVARIERAMAVAGHQLRDTWALRQASRAKPDKPDVPERIIVRKTYGHDPRPIKWDVLNHTRPEKSRRGLVRRGDADAAARTMRSRGDDVRVVQSAS